MLLKIRFAFVVSISLSNMLTVCVVSFPFAHSISFQLSLSLFSSLSYLSFSHSLHTPIPHLSFLTLSLPLSLPFSISPVRSLSLYSSVFSLSLSLSISLSLPLSSLSQFLSYKSGKTAQRTITITRQQPVMSK